MANKQFSTDDIEPVAKHISSPLDMICVAEVAPKTGPESRPERRLARTTDCQAGRPSCAGQSRWLRGTSIDDWSSWVVQWLAHEMPTTTNHTRFRGLAVRVLLSSPSINTLVALGPDKSAAWARTGRSLRVVYPQRGPRCNFIVIAVLFCPHWGANAGAARATALVQRSARATCGGPPHAAGQHAATSPPALCEPPAAWRALSKASNDPCTSPLFSPHAPMSLHQCGFHRRHCDRLSSSFALLSGWSVAFPTAPARHHLLSRLSAPLLASMAPYNNDQYGVVGSAERACRDYIPPTPHVPAPFPSNPTHGPQPLVIPVITSSPAEAANRPRGVSPTLPETFQPPVTGPPGPPPTATPQPWAPHAGVAGGYGPRNGFERYPDMAHGMQPCPMPPHPWVGGAAQPPPGVYGAAAGPMAGSVPPNNYMGGAVDVNGATVPDMWNVNPAGSLGGIPPAGAAPLAPVYHTQPPAVPNWVWSGTAYRSSPYAPWSSVRR